MPIAALGNWHITIIKFHRNHLFIFSFFSYYYNIFSKYQAKLIYFSLFRFGVKKQLIKVFTLFL